MPTPITEHLNDWRTPTVEIDAPQRLVRNIALTGAVSKNGYRYTESALRDAVPLYESKPVFLDHPASPARPLERSARDLIGAIVNPRYEDGRVRGDIQTLDTDAGRTFLALARSEQPAVGMSHVVLADRDNATVDRIHEVISVDAVVFPATTRTLHEQSTAPLLSPPSHGSEPAGDGAISNLPFACEIPSPPDAVETPLLDPGGSARLAHVPPSVTRAGPLSPPFDQPPHHPASLRSTLAWLINRLPPLAMTPLFQQQILDAPDDASRQALVQERLALLEQLTPKPTSAPRQLEPTTPTDQQLINAVRKRT